ncbi:MAG: flagellar basal body P-ring formation chaperone FlgA [Planctomycetaceae bacterium]
MTRRLLCSVFLATVLSGAVVVGTCACAAAGQPVTIILHDSVEAPGPVVRVGDLAELQGGSPAARRAIAGLDVVDTQSSRPGVISRRLVEVRLLLSDIDSSLYRLTGPKKIVLLPRGREATASIDSMVTASIQLAYAERLSVPIDEIAVTLTQPVRDFGNTGLDRHVLTRPFLPSRLGFGNVRLRLGVYADGKLLLSTVSVAVVVHRLRPVAVALQDISPGEILQASHIEVSRQPVSSAVPAVSLDQLIGRTARRSIGIGQHVGVRDVSTALPRKNEPYLIKARDRVRIVARKGTLTVVANAGEAMQNGRRGDTVRVRNSTSRRVISAKVISSTEVQVSF